MLLPDDHQERAQLLRTLLPNDPIKNIRVDDLDDEMRDIIVAGWLKDAASMLAVGVFCGAVLLWSMGVV